MNVDELALYKSSNKLLWPIFDCIIAPKIASASIIGVYHEGTWHTDFDIFPLEIVWDKIIYAKISLS